MKSTFLEGLQAKLERHFERLASERRDVGLPLFALEHGLDKEQVSELAAGLRRHIAFGNRLNPIWLVCVVYATEMGYNFDGEEYWQSFERRTPQWKQEIGRRNLLRSFFERFEAKFGGVSPSGPWARQFSIIAWPITHAVLPKDLQSQMARTLFDSRNEIAEAADRPASVLGALVARCAEWPSSRFRNFLEQEELTGHITRALLFPDDDDLGAVLTAKTQARIIADLEASWEAKSWLREARKVAGEVRIRLMFRRAADVLKGRRPDGPDPRESAEVACVTPKVLMRNQAGKWQAFVEIPTFAGWARSNQGIDGFIRRSRCKVAGGEDIWRSKRWLLFGAQQCRVLELPNAGASWLRFEEWEEGTVHAIDDACRVQPKPWLFKVDDDGCAFQAKWKNVQPGSKYLVIHSSMYEECEHLSPVPMDVRGGFGYLLSVPAQATDSLSKCLSLLGLSTAKMLKVWPAGLPPLGFGRDDLLEWSEQHPLMLGIEHDETCESFTLQLDGKSSVFPTGGRTVSFVGLGKLAVGVHQVTIAASYRASNGKADVRTQASQRGFSIVVRSPVSGTSSRVHAPVLVVATDPHEPNLDSIMSGAAACTVHGPRGMAVDFHLKLLSGSGDAIHSEFLGTLALPVNQSDWGQLVKRRDHADVVNEAYFKANAGLLVVDAHALGKASVALKHAMSPVRWHVSRVSKRVRLSVVDDTDHSHPVHAYRACFQRPSCISDSWDGVHELDVEGDGGLYVVSVNGHRSSVVVNAPPAKLSWDDWRHSAPKLSAHLTCAQEVGELLCWIRDWTDARLVGPLAEHRRNSVLREMHRQLVASMCDVAWSRLELNFLDSSGSIEAQESLEASVWRGHNPSFAIGIGRNARSIITDSLDETCEKFLQHVGPYSICSDQRLCKLALRMAVAPHRFADWAGSGACAQIDELVNKKTLLKAARLLALLNGPRRLLAAQNW
ncbi:hypothetical protein [Comamonas sp. 23]|uniref:hypothetical protein n=1 Tax=Comamonas sp. 23 TaxID=3415008 RepID=UPI003C6EA48A